MSGVRTSTPLNARVFLPSPEQPSAVLRRHFKALGKSTQGDLAAALGVSRVTANELLNNRRAIGAAMSLRLARIFDTTPEYWMDVQRDWDLHVAWNQYGADIQVLPQLRVAQRVEEMNRPIAEIVAKSRVTGGAPSQVSRHRRA